MVEKLGSGVFVEEPSNEFHHLMDTDGDDLLAEAIPLN